MVAIKKNVSASFLIFYRHPLSVSVVTAILSNVAFTSSLHAASFTTSLYVLFYVQKKAVESINSRLALVIKSGKYTLGYKSTLKSLRSGKAWLVIIGNNCPDMKKSEIEYYAMLSKTGVHHYNGSKYWERAFNVLRECSVQRGCSQFLCSHCLFVVCCACWNLPLIAAFFWLGRQHRLGNCLRQILPRELSLYHRPWYIFYLLFIPCLLHCWPFSFLPLWFLVLWSMVLSLTSCSFPTFFLFLEQVILISSATCPDKKRNKYNVYACM